MATCMINLDSAASYTFQQFCGEVMDLKPEHKASLAGTNSMCFQLVKIDCMTLDCLVAASLFGSDSLEGQTLKCLNGDVLTYTCIYMTIHCSGHAFWIHTQVFSTGTKLVNPWRACAARVTVLGLCVSVCVCYSTSHFSRVYSCHKRY